ncbi:hypothetical protein OS493_004889 [Desmophyllum pertusum]|uniref:Uncharacterized protein n=1 Tax=Desmophyllum pertusum TaxID=174260 RepID=A0A9W9Z3J8_9CNID|nr:hypothetical protein OS493_004889 [Desmophyllum pertusum]
MKVPNPPSGWSDKLASEPTEKLSRSLTRFTHIVAAERQSVTVSVWYCNDIELRLRDTSLAISDNVA